MNAPAVSRVDVLADAKAMRVRDEARLWALMDSADAITDADTRAHVTSLIYSAIQNANDTIDDERAEPESDWYSVARRTLQGLIDCGGERVTDAVVRWFADASRKAVLA